MDNMGNKKLALLYILRILEEYSDCDHPLTQSDIAQKLEQLYGIVLERKAVSRNLSLLREAGYEIESEAKGNYLDYRTFDNTELRMMIDGVLSGRYITGHQAKDLAERIAALSNRYFRSHVKHIHLLSGHEKAVNKTVFYVLECLVDAIENNRQVSFEYFPSGLGDTSQPSQRRRETVSPVQLVMKNQFYYLIAAVEVPVFGRKAADDPSHPMIRSFRLDLITNPIVEEDAAVDPKRLADYGEATNVKEILSTHPYMHIKGSHVCQASFLCFTQDLGLVAENLGTDLTVHTLKEADVTVHLPTATGERYINSDLVKVSLKIAPNDLIEFACRYPQQIFIVSPIEAAQRQEQLYTGHLKLAEQMRQYDL